MKITNFCIAKLLAYLYPDLAVLGSIPSITKLFSDKKIVDVGEVNQRHCVEESGPWLENVDQTHLVLAS